MKIIGIIFILFSSSVLANDLGLKITMASGKDNEQKAKSLIDEFQKRFDLSPYIFTQDIRIESMVIPHSHPVLTLNTREIAEPDKYLSLFLHEQIHWFFENRSEKTKQFILKMKSKYPKVPSRKDGGASDDESTYLHFGVCYYELLADNHYLGEKKAREIFETEVVYTWIRKEVLMNQDFIKNALNETGLEWKPANSK